MQKENWDLIIKPKSNFFDLRLKEIWRYRDLTVLFVKRDIVSVYKQTVLGPLWFFIQPILTSIMFTIVFGNFAGMSTDGAPMVLFYLAGLILWNYFADCLTKTSDTFIQNQGIFGKVYFPRMVVPLSVIISNLIKLIIQFILFISFWLFYYLSTPESVQPNLSILLLPILIVIIAGLSLSFGITFSALTTKYRDMKFLLQFGVQLMMYASSVVIPLSTVPENYQWIMKLNPVVPVIEAFKYGFLGTGIFSTTDLIYSFVFMIVLLLFSIMIFNRVERSFIDTV